MAAQLDSNGAGELAQAFGMSGQVPQAASRMLQGREIKRTNPDSLPKGAERGAADTYLKPCSFNWICDHLELDAPSFRRRLFEMVDGSPNGADRLPIQLEALLAEEEREEKIGADSCFEDGVI